jgi:hypothetical protein
VRFALVTENLTFPQDGTPFQFTSRWVDTSECAEIRMFTRYVGFSAFTTLNQPDLELSADATKVDVTTGTRNFTPSGWVTYEYPVALGLRFPRARLVFPLRSWSPQRMDTLWLVCTP